MSETARKFPRLRRPVRARLLADEAGAIAMPAAILLIPVSILAFGAFDFARATMVRSGMQDALDAAALSVARSPETDPAKLQTIGKIVLRQNLSKFGRSQELKNATFTIARGTVVADATIAVQPVIAHLFTHGDFQLAVHSEVTTTKDPIELALVLDNTWSMTEASPSGGDKITALETAAVKFVATMEAVAAKAGPNSVKIGVVPFSGSVNVGPSHATAAWIDAAGASPINDGIFYDGGNGSPHSWKEIDRPNRLTLFKNMGIAWRGCVESRPYPNDVRDTAPSTDAPATLFAPHFAPDEPDEDALAWNNYADDAINPSWDNSDNLFDRYWKQLQGNAKKYTASGLRSDRGSRGPNNGCDTEPVTRLTTDLARVKASVADMPVGGPTNISMGMMWGWHVLSPNAPFADGTSYAIKDVKRVAVLVTDGENALETLPSKNQSKYTGVGYVWQNRLGTTATDFNTRKKAMDSRLAELCTNLKAQGVIVFTVQVQVKPANAALLRNCASRAQYSFDVQDAGKLEETLQGIADQITKLRISK